MKQKIMRVAGIILILCGVCILSYFGYKKISREMRLRKLLDENINFEVPRLHIKVPVLEGTDNETLQVSAGHFKGTGALGHGNYCIAGHNSTIYAEIFNDLDQIKIGDEMVLVDTDADRTRYTYLVTEYKIVPPSAVDVLDDFGDDRLTVVTCTDDGTERQVIVAQYRNDAAGEPAETAGE